ncbi:MAG: STAS domain-containing protein [Desulforhopalus sp.]
MEHSLKVNKGQAGLDGILTLMGDLTILQARQTHQILFEAILEVNSLVIDLQNVGETDVSLIQLLCSAHRECFLSGKTIFIENGENESIKRLLEKAGYRKQRGCLSGAKESCLWKAC